jgi:hypothetical protein
MFDVFFDPLFKGVDAILALFLGAGYDISW